MIQPRHLYHCRTDNCVCNYKEAFVHGCIFAEYPYLPGNFIFCFAIRTEMVSAPAQSRLETVWCPRQNAKNRGICGYITNIIVLSLLRIWKAQGLDVLRQKDSHIAQMTRLNSSLWRSLLDL